MFGENIIKGKVIEFLKENIAIKLDIKDRELVVTLSVQTDPGTWEEIAKDSVFIQQ